MAKSLAMGTALFVQGEGSAYTRVGGLTSIPFPTLTKGRTEVTSFDSEAREYLPTLPDGGEPSFTGMYDAEDAGQTILKTDALATISPVREFRLDITEQDERWVFSASVGSFTVGAGGVDEALTFDSTLQVSGAINVISPIPAP